MATKFNKTISFLIAALLLAALAVPERLYAIDAKREVLGNGLTLLFSGKHNLPIVKATLLIKASPLNEPPGKAGLANLTAELLMEGTKTRSSEQISEEMEFIGAELGISTDRDYTEINLSVLKKDMDKGFELLSDILLNSTFPEHEIARKKELIKGSLKQMEEEPGFVAGKRFREALYGEHPYGRLVSGNAETIDSITRDDIVRFFMSYYRPKNAVLSIVGDLSYEEAHEILRQHFSGWQGGEVPAEPEYSIPLLERPVAVTVDRDLTQANIILGHIGIKRSNPDYYAVSVMNYILGGGGFASRLMTRIRDEMGLAYDVHSLFVSGKDKGVFQVSVQTKNESAGRVIDVILREMKRMKEEPVSEEELKDAKAFLTGSFPRKLETMGRIAEFLVLAEFYGLGMDYDRKYPEYINIVTTEDIRRVSGKYLNTETYLLVVVGDIEKAGIESGAGRED